MFFIVYSILSSFRVTDFSLFYSYSSFSTMYATVSANVVSGFLSLCGGVNCVITWAWISGLPDLSEFKMSSCLSWAFSYKSKTRIDKGLRLLSLFLLHILTVGVLWLKTMKVKGWNQTIRCIFVKNIFKGFLSLKVGNSKRIRFYKNNKAFRQVTGVCFYSPGSDFTSQLVVSIWMTVFKGFVTWKPK